jgi:predicted porin
MDDVLGAANSGFDSALSASNNVLKVPGAYASNPGNTIKYNSPEVAGLTLGASYSLKEAGTDKVSDVSLSYAAGPFAANIAYQNQKTTGEDAIKLTAVNASYNLGMVKLLASAGEYKEGDAKSTDVQVGFDVPVTAALTLSAGYAQSKDNSASTDADKRSGFGVAAGYKLGDSTTVYGGARQAKAKESGDKDNVFAVGINHAF